MNLNPPSIPPQNEPAVDLSETGTSATLSATWYQFLNLMRQAMLNFPQAVAGNGVNGRITLNGASGIVTTESLTTVANGTYTLTLTNNTISGKTNLIAAVSNGTNTGGAAILKSVAVANGSASITIVNIGTSAFNGTLQINFLVE